MYHSSGVSQLVIVVGHELYEGGVEHDGRPGIKYAGPWVTSGIIEIKGRKV